MLMPFSFKRSAVILAGGKGTRIGGYKHLRELHGKPLLLHVIEKASLVAKEVVIVLNNEDNPATYRGFLPKSVKMVTDAAPSEAPLVGIMSGGRVATSEYSAFLSCDLAFLSPEALNYLFDQAQDVDAAIPQWPDGRFEPLHAVYRTKATAYAAEAALKAGDYRNIAVARRLANVKYIPIDEFKRFDLELLTFLNVNTAEDLARTEKLMSTDSRSSRSA